MRDATSTAERSEQLLRSALRELSGDGRQERLMRQSIFAAIASDERLRDVYAEETGPRQVALDLHLAGAGVTEHHTNASAFGQFIARIADAVKEAAKGIAGQARYSAGLLVDAPAPGSLRVVLRAPEPKQEPGTDGELELGASTADSQALRLIAGAMSAASETDDPDSDDLRSSVEVLPSGARTPLRSAARIAQQAGWDITGVVAQRHHAAEPMTLSMRGAKRLTDMLERDAGTPQPETVIGHVDGLKYSLATMWFMPAGTQRSVRASVPTPDLLDAVAALVKHDRVTAVFDTYSSFRESDGRVFVQARVLRSIDAVEEPHPEPVQPRLA